jgi:uncharacterized membrane protein
VLTFVLIAIGLAFTIIYWAQHNTLFGNLERTDGKHTSLSILQIFFLLLFLYSLKLGIALESSAATRACESVTAALVGYSASWGWAYAIKDRRLLRDDVSDRQARQLSHRILAEPITATITIPLSFFPILWEVTWLSYPLVLRVLNRRGGAPTA